jgi:hypothetical protein
MSGVKCGEIRLEDEVRAAVSATYAAGAAATSALASAAALEAELADALAGAAHFLAAGVRQAHRATLESFTAHAAQLREAMAALRDRQRAIEAARASEPGMTQPTLDAMSTLGRACQEAMRQTRAFETTLRAELPDVEAVLRSERRGEAFLTHVNTRRLRGLLADIDNRLESAQPGGLRAVRGEAARLRSEIAAAGNAAADESAFARYREQLDSLIDAASTLEEKVFEQRVKHHRLMMTFEQAGYRMTPGSELIPDDYRSPARSTQLADEAQVLAQTEVHTGGELRLTMLGPSSEGPQVLICDEACDSRLQRLIEAAKAHGVRLVNVAPIPGGGFTEDETSSTQSAAKPKLAEGAV